MALDIDALQRAECEYRGIVARFDELTRAYILQVYEDGQLLRWQRSARRTTTPRDRGLGHRSLYRQLCPKASAPVPELAHLSTGPTNWSGGCQKSAGVVQ